MNKLTSSLCALALVAGLATACTDSSKDKVESQNQQRNDSTQTTQSTMPADTGGSSTAGPSSPAASDNRTN